MLCRRPISTARVTAAEPNRSRTLSSAESRALGSRSSKGSSSCSELSSSRLPTAIPDQRQSLLLDHRHRRRDQSADRAQDDVGLRGGAQQRARPGDPGEVVEAQAQHDGASGAVRVPHPSGDPVDQPDDHRVDVRRQVPGTTHGVLRTDRPPPVADAHRARIAVVSQGVQVPTGRRPQDRDQPGLAHGGNLADGVDADVVQLLGALRPDPPEPLDRQRDAGTRVRCPAALPADRPVWRPRWRPWPGTSSPPPRR